MQNRIEGQQILNYTYIGKKNFDCWINGNEYGTIKNKFMKIENKTRNVDI